MATLGILANTDIIDMSHGFGCHGNHFGEKLCVAIVTKLGILLNGFSGTEYSVYTTVWYIIGKLSSPVFSWGVGCLSTIILIYKIYNVTVIIWIFTVKVP